MMRFLRFGLLTYGLSHLVMAHVSPLLPLENVGSS